MKPGPGGVADFLAEAARRDLARPALHAPGHTWSFGELSDEVDRRAAALVGEGVEAARVHPITLEPDAGGLVTLLALWRVGATPAPLNPRLTPAERAQAEEALAGVGGGPQVILWTSGTSGRPRGVALTADNLRASARGAAARLGLGQDDVWLASLSPAHVGGIALVTRALLSGSALAAWGRFHAQRASALVDGVGLAPGSGVRVTHLSVVPTQLLQLLEARGGAPPPSTLRCALVGGAHAPADLVARALGAGWPVALTYGMTEMTSQVATAPPDRVRAKPGTVGKPLDGVELRIDGDGEVLVRGPTQAAGYVAGDTPLRDPDGWYRTGDLGRLDVDGDLWITGRRTKRIVNGGVNVDPLEVEAALRAHPGLADACVVGLPDPRWGEAVAAACVAGDRGTGADAPRSGDLEAWARARLSAAKLPRRWLLVPGLPLNANGKVDRAAVRALFAEPHHDPSGPPPPPPT